MFNRPDGVELRQIETEKPGRLNLLAACRTLREKAVSVEIYISASDCIKMQKKWIFIEKVLHKLS